MNGALMRSVRPALPPARYENPQMRSVPNVLLHRTLPSGVSTPDSANTHTPPIANHGANHAITGFLAESVEQSVGSLDFPVDGVAVALKYVIPGELRFPKKSHNRQDDVQSVCPR